MRFMFSVVLFGEAGGVGLHGRGKRRGPQPCGDDGMEQQMAADIAVRRYGRRTASPHGSGSDAPRSIGTPSDPSAPGARQGPSRWALNFALTCWSIDRLAPHLRDALAFPFDVIQPWLPLLP